MSRTVDERVVSMQFDNKNFENNVQTTLGSLEKLKQSLNFTGATKGFENINSAANNVNMGGLSGAIETVHARFSAMEVMAVTALANITNSAVNAGKRIASALTIEPIKTGFQEYETQINAVQTILANTESKGTTLQDVNRALDELNTYADKTIYNFTQMTKNIGTFTAAGIELDKSVSAIKGIANLAAVSGSTSQQASTAMYQLSQALAAGKVSLMDWNSVVNAGMGGQVFQDALLRTSQALGTGGKAAVKKYGSFRESLTKGKWLTVDVLTKTLEQFTMAAEEGSEQWEMYKKSLKEDGYTEKQAIEILKMANTATDAATKVKTFTQLWDTLKESAQSGWTQSWEIIMGDFGEAKDFLTNISDVVGEMIGVSAEARNTMLAGGLSTGWKQLLNAGIADETGYVSTLKKVAKEHNVSIDDMIKKEKKLDETLSDDEAFQIVLKKGLADGKLNSDMLTESVSKLTKKVTGMSSAKRKAAGYTEEYVKQLKDLDKGLKNGTISMDEFVMKIVRSSGRENIIDSLWNSFNAVMAIINPVKEAFSEIFPAMTGEQLYSITEKIKSFTSNLIISGDTADKIKRTFKGVFSVFDMFGKVLSSVAKVIGEFIFSDGVAGIADLLLTITATIGDFFTSLNNAFQLDGITGAFINITNAISDFITKITGKVGGFDGILSTIGDAIVNVFKFVGKGLSGVFSWIGENIGAFDIFAGLAGGGIALLATKLSGVVGKFKELMDGGLLGLIFGGKKDEEEKVSILSQIGDVFDSLGESLQAFTSSIKVASLVAIATAVGILSVALRSISDLKVENIAKALLAMGAMFVMLNVSFNSISTSLSELKPAGIIKAGISLMMLATAVKILAEAMEVIGSLPLKDLAKGLVGMAGAMTALVIGAKAIDKVKIKVSTGLALIALAKACEILGDALSKFAQFTWDEITRGLSAMGGALAEFVIAIKALDGISGFNSLFASAGLLIAVQSLDELSENLKKFGNLSWDQIGRGLAAMGGALVELGLTIGLLGKFTGFKGILGATALVIGVQALGDLASALKDFGKMACDSIGRGLAAMGGALAELGLTVGLLGGLTGFGGILGAAALVIGVQALGDLAEALKKFGGMNWEEIGRGLSAMGGALAELGLTVGLLGGLTGFGGILGAGAIVIGVQALSGLADALKKFGEMTWDKVTVGLAGMGYALAELSLAVGLLGGLTGFGAILGAGGILLGVQGLGDLADALKKFGEMTWDEIARGLVGMGGALTELAVITGVLGTLAPLGGLLGGGTLLLSIQSLGDLVDVFQKFGSMSWEEIIKGISAMGAALVEISVGGFLNTLSIIGSFSISKLAEPLGVLADSVKKWKDVTIPNNLGYGLHELAAGVSAFMLAGFGGLAIASVAEPLGVMADSIRKWQYINVPEGLSDKVSALAGAIASYTFGGLGASAIATVAGPLGNMADSIRKWIGVVIPEGLATNLESLAGAIGAFSFTGLGGWSISQAATPLGEMADSVKKWVDVVIPEELTTGLSSLADAIGAFSFSALGGWSISEVAGPLGTMADSVKKWNGVTIPEDLGTRLEELGNAIKQFPNVGNLTVVANAFEKIANGVAKVAGVKMESVSSDLSALGGTLQDFAASCENIKGVGETIISNIVTPIETASSRLETAGGKIVQAIGKGIESASKSITDALETIIEGCIEGVSDSEDDAKNAGESLGESVADGASSARTDVYNAGADLVNGFVGGINANMYKAAAKSRAMAKAAADAARKELDEHSPSRVGYKIGDFFGVAFVNAIADYGKKAYSASAGMAESAKTGLSKTIGKISDIINTDIDTQPTIRPVLDLSDVQAGASSIGSMFGLNPSIGVLATANGINSMMNTNRQNGINDDVVSAINRLDKHLDKVGGTSYNINGITYDDGSNVSDAVKTLIRAITQEGRA